MARYISKRLRRAAKDQACVRCGKEDGSVVAAHLPGMEYGMASGTSQKTHDWLVAHLCNSPAPDGSMSCHDYVDSALGRRDHRLRMMILCRTLERLFEQGVIHTIG